jgi:phosphatidylglycerol:prolipoprotein diacylglycerol transferase
MPPFLFNINFFPLFIFGFFIAVSFVVAIIMVKDESRRTGCNPDRMQDLCFWLLVAAIIGSRLLYVVANPSEFAEDPLEVFRIWNGGIAYYGGIVAAVIISIVFINKTSMPLGRTFDTLTPAIAIGHFFGWLGCFFSGCCWGSTSDLPWLVKIAYQDAIAAPTASTHPTSLYLATSHLAIFCVLLFFKQRRRFSGQMFWSYALLYGISRFLIETLLGNNGEPVPGNLFVHPVTSLSVAITALVMLIYLNRNAKRRDAVPVVNETNGSSFNSVT